MSYFDFDNSQTKERKMQEVLQLSTQMAGTQANVLIVGDPGVGKTSLARHIQNKSKRGNLHLIECKNVNASSFAGTLNMAPNSTLLLEDIDTAPLSVQMELSRQLEVMAHSRPRVIATSRRDLRAMVKQEQFRQDLFYKLAVIHLEIPNLERRKSDLISLCDFVLSVNQIIHGKSEMRLSAEAFGRLSAWRWPGNIRELENVLERAVILSKTPVIEDSNIIFESLASEQVADFAPGMSLSEVEKKLILQTLELTAQNRTRAAQMLGISIRTLRNKLNEYRGENVHEQRAV